MKLTITQNNDSIGLALLFDQLSDAFKKSNQLTLETGSKISLQISE